MIGRRGLMGGMLAAAALPWPARAQDPGPLHIEITEGVTEPLVIAIPPFADEGGAADLAGPLRDLVAADLTGTGLFRELGAAPASPADAAVMTAAAVAASRPMPSPAGFDDPVAWPAWRAADAQALVMGAVSVVDGHVFLRFRLYDIFAGRPLGDGLQFDAGTDGLRRIAHKLAGEVYARLTGEAPYFDSRVAFVAETGPRTRRIKRLALMDYDGANVRFLTEGGDLVLSPRFSPDGRKLAFVTFSEGAPRIALFDLERMDHHLLPAEPGSMSFGPRFSADGRWLVYSQERAGNTDIWQMDTATGLRRPLVEGPGIDTAPSLSPDGRRLAFESDRSGKRQIYLMPVDGSAEPERISFGEGRYGTPVWSPQGDLIAFTRQKGETSGIGVMRPDGRGERQLTEGGEDAGPSWAPNGRVVIFTRQQRGKAAVSGLHSVDIGGRNMRPVAVKDAASDPDWGPLLP